MILVPYIVYSDGRKVRLFFFGLEHTKITSSVEDVIFVVIICYLGERYEEIFLSSLKTLII